MRIGVFGEKDWVFHKKYPILLSQNPLLLTKYPEDEDEDEGAVILPLSWLNTIQRGRIKASSFLPLKNQEELLLFLLPILFVNIYNLLTQYSIFNKKFMWRKAMRMRMRMELFLHL